MARISVKATYALDVESVRALEDLARRLEVSKSEALRRAIHAAAAAQAPDGRKGLEALDRLQRAVPLSPAKAKSWVRDVRAGRRAAGPRVVAKKRR